MIYSQVCRKMEDYRPLSLVETALCGLRAQLTDEAEKKRRWAIYSSFFARYTPGDAPFRRYVRSSKGSRNVSAETLVMPPGPSYVLYHDGVICMQSTSRTTLPRTGGKRERFDVGS